MLGSDSSSFSKVFKIFVSKDYFTSSTNYHYIRQCEFVLLGQMVNATPTKACDGNATNAAGSI
jgi:hypothetical protein